MTDEQFRKQLCELRREKAELSKELSRITEDWGIPNRIRDTEMDSLRTRIGWIENDIDDLYEERYKKA